MEHLDAALAVLAALSASVYVLMISTFVAGFVRGRRRADRAAAQLAWTPRVSVLKPLAGMEDALVQNLESFARLTWPDLELVLGVASPDDPAVPIARGFLRAHPELDARLVFTDPHAALNPKVAQLLGLERAATGEILVVSDANVRVRPDYVRQLVAALEAPGVGLVTSVIAGRGEATLGAAMENLQLASHVAAGVVAGYTLTGKAISIGKSMAMRRRDLARVGGLAAVGEVLAEDHVLGQRFHAAGLGVAVSISPVENYNVGCSLRRSFERHTRWAQMRRFITPHGFYLEPLLSPVVVASLAALAHPSRVTVAATVSAVALQMVGAWTVLGFLRGPRASLRLLWLEPARALLLFVCWLRAATSRRISWRGHEFDLMPGSRLVPARRSAVARAVARLWPS